MRLLFDVDGVLANFSQGYIDIVNALYGTSYTTDDITQWKTEKALNLTEIQTTAVRLRIVQLGWAQSLQVFPGAVEAISRLRAKHTVRFVTSPYRGHRSEYLTWTHDREWWLRDRLGVPAKHVIHTSEKQWVSGDVLIDDKPSNVRDWVAANPNGMGILWDQPYNREATDLFRCSSWEHLFDIIRLLEQGRGADGPGDGGAA